jgi:hypothetical protein
MHHAECEEKLRALWARLAPMLPPGIGVALFLFDFGDTGGLAYVSNAQRDDMVRVIEEWLAKVKLP